MIKIFHCPVAAPLLISLYAPLSVVQLHHSMPLLLTIPHIHSQHLAKDTAMHRLLPKVIHIPTVHQLSLSALVLLLLVSYLKCLTTKAISLPMCPAAIE